MIVMLNGSFGVGKTTVATLLHEALPGSIIYDPEWVGYLIRRRPRWIKLSGEGTDDYQDIDLWRHSVVMGIRLFHWFVSGPVIVPMTFTHYGYFEEIVTGIKRFCSDLRIFCLKASLETLKLRLLQRGVAVESPDGQWLARRIVECVAAHQDPRFGEAVSTENRVAAEVAQTVIERLMHA